MNGTSKSLEVKASHINLDNGPGATERAAIMLLIFLVLLWGCNWPINKTPSSLTLVRSGTLACGWDWARSACFSRRRC